MGQHRRLISDLEEHKGSESGVRLDSSRLVDLVGEHEAATRRSNELRALRESYGASLQSALTAPRLVASVEDWKACEKENQELDASFGPKIEEVGESLECSDQRERAPLLAMAAEGMPEDTWVGIGDKEGVLLEFGENGEPTLRRAPRKAIELAPDWAEPWLIELCADDFARSSSRWAWRTAGMACQFAGASLLLLFAGTGLGVFTVGWLPVLWPVLIVLGGGLLLTAEVVKEHAPKKIRMMCAYDRPLGDSSPTRRILISRSRIKP